MEMFKCLDCGAVFSEDESGTISEWEGEGVMRGQLHYMCCPECRSEDIAEAYECGECGECFTKEEGTEIDGEFFCDECAKEIQREE